MVNKYDILYKIFKNIPLNTKNIRKLRKLLQFYKDGNCLVVIRKNGMKDINPLKVPRWLCLKSSLGSTKNTVMISEVQKGGNIILDFCDAYNNTFEIGSHNDINMDAQVRGKDGHSIIGDNNIICGVTLYMLCSGITNFKIGNNNLFSEKIICWAGDGHTIIDPVSRKIINLGGNVVIGNQNWIGMNVCFLKHAKIGNGCIVGYGSVVSKDLSKNNKCVIAGNPAVVVKQNILWGNNSPWDYTGKLYI